MAAATSLSSEADKYENLTATAVLEDGQINWSTKTKDVILRFASRNSIAGGALDAVLLFDLMKIIKFETRDDEVYEKLLTKTIAFFRNNINPGKLYPAVQIEKSSEANHPDSFVSWATYTKDWRSVQDILKNPRAPDPQNVVYGQPVRRSWASDKLIKSRVMELRAGGIRRPADTDTESAPVNGTANADTTREFTLAQAENARLQRELQDTNTNLATAHARVNSMQEEMKAMAHQIQDLTLALRNAESRSTAKLSTQPTQSYHPSAARYPSPPIEQSPSIEEVYSHTPDADVPGFAAHLGPRASNNIAAHPDPRSSSHAAAHPAPRTHSHAAATGSVAPPASRYVSFAAASPAGRSRSYTNAYGSGAPQTPRHSIYTTASAPVALQTTDDYAFYGASSPSQPVMLSPSTPRGCRQSHYHHPSVETVINEGSRQPASSPSPVMLSPSDLYSYRQSHYRHPSVETVINKGSRQPASSPSPVMLSPSDPYSYLSSSQRW
ncbi:hypothetical protein Tdes44962_MAKER09452 [Teratosphaeria destructans]|uniref:Uncharacterized protein n=1 Tax=Teratosphaeria destructans TaxID=418781 RepID=A0A9W7ST96_9PEZI|nr:hypothetical protein Tdes44962_MAKER09452 [Teratosphaeria destructans]